MTTYQTADGTIHYTDVEANLLEDGLLIGRVRVVRLSEALDVDGRGDVRGRIEPLPASESRPALDLPALAARRAAVTLDCFSLLLFWDCIVVSAEGDLERRGPLLHRR